MNIDVRNLGIVFRGSVNTDKSLMLLCGPNSAGKTYLSYILYAVFSHEYKFIPDCIAEISGLIDDHGKLILKKEYLDDYLDAESKAIQQNLESIFGISQLSVKRLFRNLNLNFSLTETQYQNYVFKSTLDMTFRKGDIVGKISKEKDSAEVIVTIDSDAKDPIVIEATERIKFSELPIHEYIIYHLLQSIAHAPISSSRMLTVERNSIYTFNKELSLSRNELIDNILTIDDPEINLSRFVKARSQRYPVPISESLKIANDLTNIQNRQGIYYSLAEKIETELLHGSISVTKNGDIEFTPVSTAKTSKHLPIHLTSSIVKTLSSLIIYLKHLAKKNDLLIIDEPEMNLHPDNQVILARIFARLVNAGLRLVISTHSDYIIREFNNLIMLHSLKKTELKGIIERRHYNKEELLDPKNTDVLYFNFNKRGKVEIEHPEISKYGFSIPSIDAAINAQNSNTQYIFDTLTYGPEEE